MNGIENEVSEFSKQFGVSKYSLDADDYRDELKKENSGYHESEFCDHCGLSFIHPIDFYYMECDDEQ